MAGHHHGELCAVPYIVSWTTAAITCSLVLIVQQEWFLPAVMQTDQILFDCDVIIIHNSFSNLFTVYR